jgi:hypothetical protein
METLVVNVQDGSEGCWPCIAGPDQMMLRKVVLETKTGTEVVLVHARNNCEAFRMAGIERDDVLRVIATSMANQGHEEKGRQNFRHLRRQESLLPCILE